MYFKIRYVLPGCFKAAELHCNRYDYVLTNWIRAFSAHTIISYYSQSKTGFVVISNSSVGHREMVQHNFRNFSFPEMHQSILLSTTIGSTKEDNYPIQSSHKQHCWAKLRRILQLAPHISYLTSTREKLKGPKVHGQLWSTLDQRLLTACCRPQH